MRNFTYALLVSVLGLVWSLGLACESTGSSQDPGTGTATESEADTSDNDSVRGPVEFDITDREHVGVRLTLLLDILKGGNPLNDPVGWAQAGAAAGRIETICDNFDAPEVIDPACDQLLIALETPYNQLAPIIASAQTALREIVSRRDVAGASWATEWDNDIADFSFTEDWVDIMREIRSIMVRSRASERCLPEARGLSIDFIAKRLDALLNADNVANRIAYAATEDLSEEMSEYAGEDSGFGCSLDADTIIDELDDLGIYGS